MNLKINGLFLGMGIVFLVLGVAFLILFFGFHLNLTLGEVIINAEPTGILLIAVGILSIIVHFLD